MGTSGEQLRRTRPSLASLGRMVKRSRRDSGGTMPATVDSWRMRMAEPWTIKGEYLENCNCEVLCPCLLGPRNARGGAMARPTAGAGAVPVVFAGERGAVGTRPRDGSEVWMDKVRHFVSSRLAAARATRSTYTDHGFDWSNVGRNGHYSAFDWSGG